MSIETVNGHELIPNVPDWGSGVRWTRAWETTVVTGVTGAEDRAAMRQVPRVGLKVDLLAEDTQEAEVLTARIRAAMETGAAAMPYWGRSSTLASALSTDEATIDATDWPWTAGDYVFLLDPAGAHEVRQVDSVASNVLTLDQAVARTYPAGARVWPMLFGTLQAKDLDVPTPGWMGITVEILEQTGTYSAKSVSPTTYLSRPILETVPNWAGQPTESIAYDLREIEIGFGAAAFEPLQNSVIHGFKTGFMLETVGEIEDMDGFFSALHGRLAGFWFPGPRDAATISGGVDATRFDIEDQSWADSWTSHPAAYLLFEKAGETAQQAKITAVSDNGDGTERVTVNASVTVDETWTVRRLHYVRQASDTEQGRFRDENLLERTLSMVELPEEYTTAETGEQPVFLYHFQAGSTHWRYTSFAQAITSNSQTFSAKAINHGSIRESITREADSVTVSAAWESGHPLDLGFPYPPSEQITLTIQSASYSDPDTVTTIFTGRVQEVKRDGKRLAATIKPHLDLGSQRLPGPIIGPRCNWQLGSTPCGVSIAAFQVAATISTISSRVIRVSHVSDFGQADQYWTFGFIEVGAGTTMERRSILKDVEISSTVRELTLNLPLQHASVSDTVTVTPGCNGNWSTCQDKFGNLNHSGHPFVPTNNPTLKAMETPTGGGKK